MMAKDIERLVNDVSSLSFTGFFDAVMTTGRILGEAPFVLRDCESLKEDLNTLNEQAQVFLDIDELSERIAKNYVWHYSEIMSDLANARDDESIGDYYSMGECIGEAVFISL